MNRENFGICILGMGDCGSHINQTTENFNTNISENFKSQMINKNTVSNFMTGSSQNFMIKNLNCGGDLNISNIQQKSLLKIDFSVLDTSIDKNTFDNMAKEAVNATIDRNNDVKQEFASNGADITTRTTNINTNISRIVNDDVFNDFKTTIAKMKADQDMQFIDMRAQGSCNISDIKQDIQIDMICKVVSDKLTENFNKLIQENSSKVVEKNKNKVESTGFFGDLGRGLAGLVDSFTGPFKWIAILIGLAIVVSVLGVAIWRVISAATGHAAVAKPDSLSKAVGAMSKGVSKVASKVSSTGTKPGTKRGRGGMFGTMYGGW